MSRRSSGPLPRFPTSHSNSRADLSGGAVAAPKTVVFDDHRERQAGVGAASFDQHGGRRRIGRDRYPFLARCIWRASSSLVQDRASADEGGH